MKDDDESDGVDDDDENERWKSCTSHKKKDEEASEDESLLCSFRGSDEMETDEMWPTFCERELRAREAYFESLLARQSRRKTASKKASLSDTVIVD